MLSEEDIDRIVEKKVKAVLQKKEKKTCAEWLKLRKEIDTWCHVHGDYSNRRSYQTLQNLIYSTLKFVTGVSRIDEIDESNIWQARDAWNYLKFHHPYNLVARDLERKNSNGQIHCDSGL